MEPLNPTNEEDQIGIDIAMNGKQLTQIGQANDDVAYVEAATVCNEDESHHAMLAMENVHMCYVANCGDKGVQQCAGLRTICVHWMCDSHGVIAHKQHWCGGGGCGLEAHDKYCEFCAKKANKDSWLKLAFISAVLLFLVIIVITHYT